MIIKSDIAKVCGGILLGACTMFIPRPSVPDHSGDAKEIKERVVGVDHSEIAFKAYRDSVNVSDSVKKVKIDSIIKKQDDTKQQLSFSKARITLLVDRIHEADNNKDTVTIVKTADTLAKECPDAFSLVMDFQRQAYEADSLYRSRIDGKDSIIRAQDSMYHKLKDAFMDVTQKYGSLYTDYGKVSKRTKFQSVLGRVKTGAIIAAVAAFILKK